MKVYKSLPSKKVAKKMLEDDLANDANMYSCRKLTKKQKRLFGLIAAGKKPRIKK